jgi:hypothetical protein
MDYYLQIGEQSVGPLPPERLIAAGLTPTTLVWRDGWAGWRSAASVPELRAWLTAAQAPAAPPPPVFNSPFGPAAASPYASPAAEATSSGLPHSGLGLLSLGFGLGSYVIHGVGLVICASAAMAAVDQGLAEPPMDGTAMLGGMFMCIGVVVNMLGGLVGLLGCFYSGRKRLLAVLGLLANAAPLALVLLLMLMGMAIG